uniref:Uncharacterized protein n=1 Tax=Arundo donax TaxID=35708 RepID=A0A0A9F4M8_ARUDO
MTSEQACMYPCAVGVTKRMVFRLTTGDSYRRQQNIQLKTKIGNSGAEYHNNLPLLQKK